MALRITVPPPVKQPSVQPMMAAKHFDIVLGLDFHMLRVPFFITPCPITPFGALVFDPMDYIHVTIPAMPTYTEGKGFSLQPAPMGGTVTVNGFYRGGATTSLLGMPPTMPPIPAKFKGASAIAKKLSLLHLVLPKPLFWFPFLAPHDGQISMGSSTVISQGLKQSTHMDPAWSCNELGKILMNSPTALYNDYATRIMIVLPLGRPVIVGGARVYPEMGLADLINALIMMGILKGGGKLARKGLGKALTKLNKALSKKFPKYSKFGARIQPKLCKYLGEPVDAASGHMASRLEGFSLPGPIPFTWEANYYSDTAYEGSLGKSIIHTYDISMKILEEEGLVLINDSHGRGIAFSALMPGQSEFNAVEKCQLHRDIDNGEYYVNNKEGLYFYFHNAADKDGLKPVRSIVNRNGFAIRFQYDTNGRLKEITDSAGRQILVHNDEKGRIASLEIPHPSGEGTFTPIAYTYDAEGRMISMIDADGYKDEFGWDKKYMVTRKFKEGTEFSFTYDREGRCTAAEGPEGLFSYFFDYQPGHTIVTNSLGKESHYYHRKGLVIRQINPEGGEKIFTYDGDHNLMAEKNEIGIVHTFEYDEAGNVIKMGLPGRGEASMTYNDKHLLTSTRLPNNATWEYKYDEAGNVLETINPEGETMKYTYHNGLLQTISANEAATEFWYDRQYNLAEAKLPAGKGLVKFTYDALGNCIKITDPQNNHHVRRYDLKGRITQLIDPDGDMRRFAYDANDNIVSATDNYVNVQVAYNFFGDIVKRIQGGIEVNLAYDKEGQLQYVRNEFNEYYLYEYDGDGNVISETGFDGLTRRYFRDLSGQVVQVERPGGKNTRYNYNSDGKPIHILYSDGTRDSFEYDVMGNMLQAINDQQTVAFQRDLLGRVIRETQGEDWIKNVFNKNGVRERLQSSLGADIIAQLNIQTGLPDLVRAGSYEARMRYDKKGQLIEREMNGEIREKFEYDKKGRLVNQETVQEKRTRHRRQYTWEGSNRLKKVVDTETGQKQLIHDVHGNLAEVIYSSGNVEYRVPDVAGNLFETRDRHDRKYGKGGRLLTSRHGTYDYDEEGRLIRKTERNGGVWEYEWNGAGMLQKVIRPDKGEVTFGYDALGRRIWKRYKSTITRWLWDANVPLHEWKEFEARESNANDLITWIFEQDSMVPVGKIKGGKSYSIIADHLGTPIKSYNEAGDMVWSRELNSYGQAVMLKGEEGFCNYLYQGQYEDPETGLAYNRFRYYAPEEGMYISQDDLRLAGGMALYGYVHDPAGWIDPFGFSCTKALRKNINKAQRELKKKGYMKRAWRKEKGSAAHHIVAGDHTNVDAQRARDILDRNNIDVNSAENGIYLRHMDPNSTQPGAYHREIHTNEYFQNVADRLELAETLGGRDGVLSELESIQNDLLFNNKIW